MRWKGKITFFLVLMLFVATFIVPSLPNASAKPTIAEVKPSFGPVGTNVTVMGQIDTLNGSYRILWDEKGIKNGTCAPGSRTVNDTFIVPHSVEGLHNITLLDITSASKSEPASFTVVTFYSVLAKPAWIQEGLTTTLNLSLTGGSANTNYNFTVEVTDPRGTPYNYTASVTVKTNSMGVGWSTSIYPTNFTTGANTNYTGTYSILVDQIEPGTKIGVATGNFTVGLTDKLEYHATETVNIRGSGYQANENVTIDIKVSGASISGYPKNVTANIYSILNHSWYISIDAIPGIYTVTLTNTTALGTIKSPPDIQNFTVTVVTISIKPSSGFVGTTVRAFGEIITLNGFYEILWDKKRVKNGTCALGSRTVNDTFTVPSSVRDSHNVTLVDATLDVKSAPTFFIVNTSYIVFAKPEWMQEGLNTTITVSVDGAEANATYTFKINVTTPRLPPASYIANLSFTTNGTGSGIGSKKYWGEFVGANATKTDFVGNYTIAVNETLAVGIFTVGLTDKPKYRREEGVSIRGSAYQPYENVTINIEFGGEPVAGYPINVTANAYGIVTSSLYIPVDAMPGTYTVSLVNATTPGTTKTPPDIQNFTVTGIIFRIQTLNLDEEPVADVDVEAYSNKTLVDAKTTNQTGWVEFRLEADNYTFRAFWIRGTVEIGSLFKIIPKNATLIKENMTLSLARIGIEVRDEAGPLYLVDISLKYNYTTRANTTASDTESLETDINGIAIAKNMLANIPYGIEARRYGYLFNQTVIENLTASCWVNITCPTYTLFIHALDSNGLPIGNVNVSVHEWSTWNLVRSPQATNESGSILFRVTFGKYKVKVYNYSEKLQQTVILNETVIDLVEDPTFLVIQCKLFNLNLSVKVVDYFGRPIPNALVKVKRENVEIEDLTTGSNGIASLDNVVGGYYQVSVYIREKLCGIMSPLLDRSKEIVFKIDRYVVIGGYPMETSQLITLVSLSLLVGAIGLALFYRKVPSMMKRKKTPSEKGG